LATIDSLTNSPYESSTNGALPIILSKIEKFALSLKDLQESDECCKPSMCSISSINSLDDVEKTLKVFGVRSFPVDEFELFSFLQEIRERLVSEKEELHSLLHSVNFSGDLVEIMEEFEPLSAQYEDAILKVEQLVQQVEKVKRNWSDWAEIKRNLQNIIVDVENELVAMRKGSNNCNHIASELELCQERMNRLETVCNYLTASLSELPENSSASQSIDFAAELTKYSNAIMELKRKYEFSVHCLTVQSYEKKPKQNLYAETLFVTPKEQRGVQLVKWSLILFCSAVLAFLAWFASLKPGVVNNWKNAPGLHLDYLNGPPPT
uniref:KASH domain-containing protein n=1 Tax=Enterobius vermicularis TaxID=51028 RepID=A0A0N4UXK9_ENTVE